MVLNNVGLNVKNQWDEIPNRVPGVCLDEREFMPNHIHGIILIVGAQFIAPHKKIQLVGQTKTNKGAINRAPTLGEIIRSFKAITTRQIRLSAMEKFGWQRNYYEHIVRDEKSLLRIREYISTNPLRWEIDRENPRRKGEDEFDRWLATFKTRPES